MKIINLVAIFALGAVLFLVACGGGGSGSLSNLAGTWYGNYDNSGTARTLSVTVSSSNSITSVSVDGTDQGLTGSISNVQSNLYSYILYKGSAFNDEGGFLVDAAKKHAGFLSSVGDFGVVEKGGSTAAITYTVADLDGTWSGYTISLDNLGNITNYDDTSTVTVDGVDGSFTGSNASGAFANAVGGELAVLNSSHGAYEGLYDDATGISGGYVQVWISPDKTFAAAYACDPAWGTSPRNGLSVCTYSSWVKQ